MNWKYLLLITALLLSAGIPMFYKTTVLGMDFFPSVKQDAWAIEYTVKVKGSPKRRRLSFPVPRASKHVQILETQFEGRNLAFTIKETSEGAFAELAGVSPQNIKVFYRVHVRGIHNQYPITTLGGGKPYSKSATAFLSPISLDAVIEEKVSRLEQELFTNRMTRSERVKTLYYFVHEEILKAKKNHGLEQALLKSKGSSRDKAELFTVLARRQGIPARTVMGIELIDKEDISRSPRYWNEVYSDNGWIPVLLKEGLLGEIPESYIALATSKQLRPEWPRDGLKLTLNAERLNTEQFSVLEYRKQLALKKSVFVSFSPYMLPLSEQPGLKLLLLFAFGTVVLAFCRNVIGMKSFGIFFPVLLALFFKDTSLWFGIGFFAFIMLLGSLERRLLTAMHLLAVPRFAIILTLLVMTLLLFAILNNQYQMTPYSPTILPIIITTMFIERFTIMWEEEGWVNTGQALLGTLFISLASYSLFSWEFLERLLYTHPESLFAVIALLVIIGRYTGYRLSELVRFRELTRHRQ